MRVILEVIACADEKLVGKRFEFDQREAFVVGRKKSERVQLRIPTDPYFSRHHMRIEICPPHCVVHDLNSHNGTFVNGEQVDDKQLQDGDILKGGRTEIRVSIDQTPAESAPPPPSLETPDQQKELGMETTLFGRRPDLSGPKEAVCQVCGAKAGESYLDELSQTGLLAYVCAKCTAERKDAEHPVPNYEKLGVLGRGSLGPVYKARQAATGRLVALKLLASEMVENPQAVKLFLREMMLAAGLRHPRIVPVVQIGQGGRDLWIASEYVEGVDARELARQRGGCLPPADAVAIVCQALAGLQYAHEKNLVHRDVKPSNILVSGRPGAYEARLADFGLLRHMDEAGVSGITREGDVRGTLPFMPREQVVDSRFVKPAGDIYGAGATLYWLLTGEYVRDFEATDGQGQRRDPYVVILEDAVIPIRRRNPAISQALSEAIHRALADEPEDRYESAAEMARALLGAVFTSAGCP